MTVFAVIKRAELIPGFGCVDERESGVLRSRSSYIDVAL